MNLVQGQAVMDLPGKDNNCRAESLGLEEDPDKASTWSQLLLTESMPSVRNKGHHPSKDMSPDSGAGVDY